MRNRSLFGFAATLCVFAVAAAPALGAKEFKATEVGKEFAPGETGKEKGAGTEIQDFKFGAFHILCEGAKAKGRVDFTMSKTLFLSVRYKPCYALAKLSGQTIRLQAKFKTPWDFEYHANGFAEVGAESESELKLVKGGAIEMTVPSIKCLIEVPAQTVPLKAESKPEKEFSSVLYFNEEVAVPPSKKFPGGFQKQLLIANELKGMEYELSEGQCEEFKKTEGKNSSYKGSIKDMIVNGNLSIG